jgi:phosphoserine aminotransferase
MNRVYNFGAGPAMLPLPVMERIRDEFLDYRGMGASVIEISHRSKEFQAIQDEAKALLRELAGIPDDYRILFVHGGARMQFAALPLNLAGRSATRACLYAETGNFSQLAIKDAQFLADVKVIASGAADGFRRIPAIDPASIDPAAAYLHITSNNTVCGTRWQDFPETGGVPLIADQTSEILSRVVDYRKFGAIYAGLQKNLGPSGMAVVVLRADLLGHAAPHTPLLLNYAQLDKDDSLTNTTNTFAVYVVKCMLEWLKEQGGVAAMERRNQEKAACLYRVIDSSELYHGYADRACRSIMNVTFHLPTPELEQLFLQEALVAGLYALEGHRAIGGLRASIYNPMPLAGVEALAQFMTEFGRKNG